MPLKYLTILALALLVAVSVGSAAFALLRSRHWPQTQGLIKRSEVVREERRPRANPPEYWHRAVIQYTYQVDGVDYESDVILPGIPPVYDYPARADELVAQYPAGANVPVYYDPEQPSRAALVTAASIPPAAGIALGVIAGIVVAAIAFAYVKLQKTPAP